MIIAHLSDAHLGHRQYGLDERLEDYNRAFLNAIDEIIRLKEELDIDAVVISGDLFDTQRPPPSIYITAIRGLTRLKEAGIRVFAIRGNHDASVISPIENPLSVLHQMGLLHYLDNEYVDIGHVRIIGVGTVYADMQARLVSMINNMTKQGAINIAVIHQYIEGTPCNYPMPNLDVFTIKRDPLAKLKIDYFAVGHIHEFKARSPGINAVYPGSLEIWDAREFETYEYSNGTLRKIKGLDEKGFLLLDLGGNNKIRVKPIRLRPLRRMIRIYVRYSNEVKPSTIREDISYLAENFDIQGGIVIIEVEGELTSGFSTRDVRAFELRRLFTRAWVDIRLNLRKRQRQEEQRAAFQGINDILRHAFKSRLNDDALVGLLLDIVERVRLGDERSAISILEKAIGIPLRGYGKSIVEWLR